MKASHDYPPDESDVFSILPELAEFSSLNHGAGVTISVINPARVLANSPGTSKRLQVPLAGSEDFAAIVHYQGLYWPGFET